MSETVMQHPENDVRHLPRQTPTAKVLGALRRGLIAEGFADDEALEVVLTAMRTHYALVVEIPEGGDA